MEVTVVNLKTSIGAQYEEYLRELEEDDLDQVLDELNFEQNKHRRLKLRMDLRAMGYFKTVSTLDLKSKKLVYAITSKEVLIVPVSHFMTLKQRMQRLGYKLVSVGGSSCQFSAIAFAYGLNTSEARDEAIQWMRDHPHSVNDQPLWTFENKFWETYKSWDQYCDELAKPTTWGNEISLTAFAEAYGCPIQVYSWQESGDFSYVPNTFNNKKNPTIFLAYLPTFHYYALAPAQFTEADLQAQLRALHLEDEKFIHSTRNTENEVSTNLPNNRERSLSSRIKQMSLGYGGQVSSKWARFLARSSGESERLQELRDTILYRLQKSWSLENLDKQRKKYGTLLCRPFCVDQHGSLLKQMIPHIGKDSLQHFWIQVKTNNRLQDSAIIAMAQTSGAGKTKLGYSIGMHYTTVFMIPLHSGYRRSEAVTALSEAIDAIWKDEKDELSAHRKSLHAVRLFVLAHLLWMKSVWEHAKTTWDIFGQDKLLQRKLILQSQENGVGTMGVQKELYLLFKSVNLDDNAEETIAAKFKEFAQWFKANLEPEEPLVIFYDEIAEIKGVCRGRFFHQQDVDTALTEEELERVQRLRKLEESGKLDGTSPYTQIADLFYALQIVMLELLHEHSWPQLFASTKFSICDAKDLLRASPTRNSLKTFYDTHIVTPENMVDFLEEAFDKFPETKREEVLQSLEPFRGRPLFFVDYFLAPFLHHCEVNPCNDANDLANAVITWSKEAFNQGVITFSRNVIEPYAHNQDIPLPTKQTKTVKQLLYEIYFHIRCRNAEIHCNAPEEVKELATAGFLHFNDAPNKKIPLDAEPLFVAATLLALNTQQSQSYTFTMLRMKLDDVDPKTSTKGYIAEDLIAWFIIHHCNLKEGPILLQDLIKPLLNVNMEFPGHLCEAEVYLKRAIPMSLIGPDDFNLAFGKNQSEDLLLYRLHQNAGPDFLLPFHLNGNRGILVIQSKAKEAVDLVEAVQSISWSKRFVKYAPQEFSTMIYVKAVFSVKPFSSKNQPLCKAFQKHNSQPAKAPILILDKLSTLPSDVQETLLKTCEDGPKELQGPQKNNIQKLFGQK